MGLLKLKFGCVLAGDDPLGRVDEIGQAVEQGGLARARPPRDQDVASAGANDLEDAGTIGADRFEIDQIAHGQLVFLELADGQGRAVNRQRRGNDIDAAAIGQAGITDGRAFIDPSTDLRHNPLTDIHQLGIVAKADGGQLNLAIDLDEDPVGPIDHDVSNVVAHQ